MEVLNGKQVVDIQESLIMICEKEREYIIMKKEYELKEIGKKTPFEMRFILIKMVANFMEIKIQIGKFNKEYLSKTVVNLKEH